MHDPELIIDGPAGSAGTLILAHGAGQGMRSPFMDRIARAVAGSGLRVVRFEFPYMIRMGRTGTRKAPDREPVLLAAWNDAIDKLLTQGGSAQRILIGGKSMGGRMASLIAVEREVAGLVCLGYPFHPPGRPGRLRTGHLLSLSTPALICQGTRDSFGRPEEVAGYGLAPSIRMAWIEDGDHSFRPRKQSGRTWEQNLRQAAEEVVAFARSIAAAG